MNELIQKLSDLYPFLTICKYGDDEYVGIIQNSDDAFTSLYDFGQLPDDRLKKLFLKLGETWWWESNQKIAINLFLKREWEIFKPYTRTFTTKTLTIISGPVISLNNINPKKRRRCSVHMVKRM